MTQIEEELLKKAKEVSLNAHAPYSNFPVGAAVLTTDGKIYVGCNVENSSFGLTVCAERNAVFQAVAASGTEVKITRCALYTATVDLKSPCGACRQVLSDFAQKLEVLVTNKNGDVKRYRFEELMPQPFKF
ncbi:MAG: cytidine deaminase [Cyclobacteriaceae bacterium]